MANFSGKIYKRITDAYGGSPFRVVGGTDLNRGAIRRRLIPVLDATQYIATGDPQKDGLTKGNVNLVTNILLGNSIGVVDAGYVVAIGGGKDLDNLPRIAVDIAENKADETKTVFRMVFGASEAYPLRSISYPVPVLQMMTAMRDRDITPPQLQIVFANNISAGINGLSSEKVTEQTKLFVNTEREYIKRFFPELFDRVVFLQDKPMQKGGELRKLWTSLTTAVDENLDPKLRERILKKGGNPSEKNLAYASAHLLFHDIATQGLLVPYDDNNPSGVIDPETVISFGGIQEKDFYLLRNDMMGKYLSPFPQYRTLQLLTAHAAPPYYYAREGDVSLGKSERAAHIDEIVICDLTHLHIVSDARGNLGEFLLEGSMSA